MATFNAHCKRCDEKVSANPADSIILFVGESPETTFFNWRCPQCNGIEHCHAGIVQNYPGILEWLTNNKPMVVPAEHQDDEILELCENVNIPRGPINQDDLLDLMLDLERIENERLDLRKESKRFEDARYG